MSEENKNENELNSAAEEAVNEETAAAADTAAEETSAAEENTAAGTDVTDTAAEGPAEGEGGINEADAQEGGDYGEVPEGMSIAAEPGEDEAQPAAKKKPVKLIAGIAAAVVVIAAAVTVVAVNASTWFNPYNRNYVDVTGRNAGEVADMMGMDFSEFLEYYDLPEDLSESTSEYATMYTIPAGTYAELFAGADFSELADALGWGDDITEETTIGEAIDTMTLNSYCGEDGVEAFKEEYGLGDDVTGDTLYGDVRHQVEIVLQEQYQAQLNPTDEPEEEPTEAATETAAATEAADAAAADEAAADGTTDTAADAAAAE